MSIKFDDFEIAYRARLEENRLLIALYAAVFRLTDVASRPTPLAHVARDLGQSVAKTRTSIQEWGGDVLRIEGDMVHLNLAFAERPDRFQITIGGRTLHTNAGGCAGDIFAIMLWTGKPLQVSTRCPVTGLPVRVAMTPDGVGDVEPPDAVISIADPNSDKFAELKDDPTSQVICRQQNFYASTQAARDDPELEPGARLLPAGDMLDWIRRVGVIDRS